MGFIGEVNNDSNHQYVNAAFMAALTGKFYPNNWKTVAVGAGIFYGQQAVRG